jgi:anaerobic magnesium-protoporphyrin IX monomethyl ester cyclase
VSQRDHGQATKEVHMAKLDLVLINPGSRTQVYQSLGNRLTAIENPVWAGLMATFCRRKGLSVEIIDAEAEELVPAEVAERVQDLAPTLAAVVVYGHQPSASTQIMTACGQVCTAIKELSPTQNILMVGGHVAALPERTLCEEDADFVAAGEGLHTLVSLVAVLKTAAPDFEKVPGLWYRQDGRPRHTPDRPLVADLDNEMPGPAWDLLPMGKYRAHNWHCLGGLDRQPYAALYTTLGCPYHCSFCCIQAPFKSGEEAGGVPGTTNSYRYWSPDTVVDQLDVLVNQYGVRNIKIADEMFVLNRRHVLGICDRIIERGYDLNIWAYTRVDTIKDGMMEKLKAAGVNWLAFGIEAGAARVRANVDKAFDQDEVFRVIGRVRDAGINVIGNYIFGLPEDDLETMQATLDLALDLNCEFANFYSAMAYPGSPLYSLAIRQGVPLPQRWSGYSQHARDSLPLPTRYIPAREVLRFRDEAFQRYYTHPRYLEMAERRFGPDTVEHLRQMTAYRLERDLLDGTMEVEPTLLPAEESAGAEVVTT